MRTIKFSLLATAFTFAVSASAQTATFSSYASPATQEFAAAVGAPVVSGGLDFYNTEYWDPNARNVLGAWGSGDAGSVNRPTNIGSSVAMYATTPSEIDIYGHGADFVTNALVPFNIFSMDVAHVYSTVYSPLALSPFTLTIFGFGIGNGGATISQTFSIAAPTVVGGIQNPVLQTLVFDARWRNMYNVYWNQGSSVATVHQFTNVVTVSPEPGTYALMATGLFLVGFARTRKPKMS